MEPRTLAQQWWHDPIRRTAILAALVAASLFGLLLAFALDYVVWSIIYEREFRDSDKFRLFKATGYIPAWIAIGVALMLIDWPKLTAPGQGLGHMLRRGVLLIAGPAVGGASAEVLKLILRRGRPPKPPDGTWDGLYVWQGFDDVDTVISTGGLSMPSSHTSIAFGATWMLCFLYPRATPVWLIIGVGCGLTRMLDHAHHLSDVYLSAVTTGFLCLVIWRSYEAMLRRYERADAIAANKVEIPEESIAASPTDEVDRDADDEPPAAVVSIEAHADDGDEADAAPAEPAWRLPRDPVTLLFLGVIVATALVVVIATLLATWNYVVYR